MSVPIPEANRAVDIGKPVNKGTNTVALNIAKTCWKLNANHLTISGRSFASRIKFLFSDIFFLRCIML